MAFLRPAGGGQRRCGPRWHGGPSALRIVCCMLAVTATSGNVENLRGDRELTCLPEYMVLDRTTLAFITFQLRKQNFGTLRMAQPRRDTQYVLSEIFRIIATDYLGYDVQTLESMSTADTYKAMANDELDVDVELWRSEADAVYSKYAKGMRSPVVDAGALSYAPFARSGLYLRPSPADRELMLKWGRFYMGLESVVMPRLPEITSILDDCVGANRGTVSPSTEVCKLDTVNTVRCLLDTAASASFDEAGSGTSTETRSTPCKAIIKESRDLDAGVVERMVQQGNYPLSVVYAGVGGTERLLRESQETLLFHYWEPSTLISDGSSYVRVMFDPEQACTDPSLAQTYQGSQFPSMPVCDWPLGQPHKAYARRITELGGNDIATLVSSLDMEVAELADLADRAQANGTNLTSGAANVACEWVIQNYDVWQQWLRTSERSLLRSPTDPLPDTWSRMWQSWLLLIAAACAILLTLWLCLPLCLRGRDGTPTPAQTWETWSMYPGIAHRVCGCILRLFRPCAKRAAKQSAAVGASALKASSKSLSALVPDSIEAKAAESTKKLKSKTRSPKRTASVAPNTDAAERRREEQYKKQTPLGQVYGVQWALRRLMVQEGQTLQLSIVRDKSVATPPVKLRVWGSDLTTKKLCSRSLEALGVQEVSMPAGATHVEFPLSIAHVNTGSLNLKSGVWQPERSFAVHLEVTDAHSSVPVGELHTCTIVIIDTDEWPVSGASKMGAEELFNRFVWQVIKDNFHDEAWWLIGTLLRAAHAYILDPLLLKWLLDFAIGEGNVEIGIQIAISKAILIFIDQYTYFHYNSNVGISIYSPVQWLLYKWQSLPLEIQLDHIRNAEFVTLMRRIDNQFPSTGYNSFCKVVNLVISIFFSLVSVSLLAPGSALYLYAVYAVAIATVFCAVGRTVPKDIASVNDSFWHLSSNFNNHLGDLFNEMVANACSWQSMRLSELAIKAHSERSDVAFALYYISETQTMYTRWIMLSVLVLLYGAAALLVEFKILSTGEFIGIAGSITGACGNIIALVSMRDQIRVARDLVDDLSRLLSSSMDRAARRVESCKRASNLIRHGLAPNLATEMSLHKVDYTTAAIDHMLGSGTGLNDAVGSIPIGGLYGYAERRDTEEQQRSSARMSITFDLLAGLRTPTDGAVLLPPHVDVRIVPRDPGIIERGSVFQNLAYGLSLDVDWSADEEFFENVIALCRRLQMDPSLFGKRTPTIPMMQASMFSNPSERSLVALVRAMLPLPDVLLINDLGRLGDEQALLVHDVLERFVEGHDLAGLIADERPPPPERPPRTVIWVAAPDILVHCGVSRMIDISSDYTSVISLYEGPPALYGSYAQSNKAQLSSPSPPRSLSPDLLMPPSKGSTPREPMASPKLSPTPANGHTAPTEAPPTRLRHGLLPPLQQQPSKPPALVGGGQQQGPIPGQPVAPMNEQPPGDETNRPPMDETQGPTQVQGSPAQTLAGSPSGMSLGSALLVTGLASERSRGRRGRWGAAMAAGAGEPPADNNLDGAGQPQGG